MCPHYNTVTTINLSREIDREKIYQQKLENWCEFKIISHLEVVCPADQGEVDAEHNDKYQEANQQEKPVLTPKLDTWNIFFNAFFFLNLFILQILIVYRLSFLEE